MMYAPIFSATAQWFSKRRGIALGIVASGSPIGGLIFPFIATAVNKAMGFAWTYRILGCICLFLDVLACIFVKERVKYATDKKKRFDLQVLKNKNFLFFVIASDVMLVGYFVPIFCLPGKLCLKTRGRGILNRCMYSKLIHVYKANATHLGLTDSQGSSCVVVVCAMSFFGRLIAGYITMHAFIKPY